MDAFDIQILCSAKHDHYRNGVKKPRRLPKMIDAGYLTADGFDLTPEGERVYAQWLVDTYRWSTHGDLEWAKNLLAAAS